MAICLDFISNKAKGEFKEIKKDLLIKDTLRVESLPNATILPYKRGCGEGGVIRNDLTFVTNTTLHEEFGNGAYSFVANEMCYKNFDVVFIGTLFSCYGHAITDNLKKIWFLFTEEGKKLVNEGALLGYIPFHAEYLPDYVFQILSYAGVPVDKLINIETITRYRNVYVPDNSISIRNKRRFYSIEFKSTIDRLKANILKANIYRNTNDSPKYEKVYFSRTALHDGRDFGEKEVEVAFEQCGYIIVHPEQLPLYQQVYIAANCKHFASTEGSIAHNSIFCETTTSVEILRKSNYVNDYQLLINNMQELNVTYIDAHHTLKKRFPWGGPFFLSVTPYLRRFLHFGGGKDLYWFQRHWYAYLLRELRLCMSSLYYLLKKNYSVIVCMLLF